MAKLLYCFKIFIFRHEVRLTDAEKEGLRNFLIFVVTVYIGAWFRCTNAIAAPRRDLELLKTLSDYETLNIRISQVTVEKFCRHLWYLNEILVGLSFFDPNVSNEEKDRMLGALHQVGSEEIPPRVTITAENIGVSELHHFITENTLVMLEFFHYLLTNYETPSNYRNILIFVDRV
jgi:hypothetical protein